MAGRGSTAWIGRHGVSCLLRFQHRLRIWGRRHGQNRFGEKRGRVRLSRLLCPEVVTRDDGMCESQESGDRPRFSERARKCGSQMN